MNEDENNNFINNYKLTINHWTEMEIPLSINDQNVSSIMMQLGKNISIYDNINDNINDNIYDNRYVNIFTYGDIIYKTIIKPLLIKNNILSEPINYTKIHTKNNLKATDKIIIKNTNKLLLSYSKKDMTYIHGFESDIIDYKYITLMYMCNYALNNNILESIIYKLILTIKYTIETTKQISFINIINKDKQLISDELISDLRNKLILLITYSSYNINILFEKYPYLTNSANYFKILPDKIIKPYHDQIRLINLLNINESLLCFYTSHASSGKTTSIISICSYIMNNTIKEKTQLLYCCSIDTVKSTVSKLAYNNKIPFGIAFKYKNNTIIRNHWNCEQDNDRIMIIADPICTYDILCKCNNYILFIDEPTIYADKENNIITEYIAKIFDKCPNKIILASATLPDEKYMIPYIEHMKDKISNPLQIHTLNSQKQNTSYQIMDFNGQYIIPHSYCITLNEMKNVINKINVNQLVGNLYNASMLNIIVNKLNRINIYTQPLSDIFSNINNICNNFIKKVCIDMLNLLHSDIDVLNFNSITDSHIMYSDLNFKKIGKYDSYKLLGCTLFVCTDPIKKAQYCFSNLINNIPSAYELIKEYNKKLNIKKHKIESIIKNIKDEAIQINKIKKIEHEFINIFNFPDNCKINTFTHFNKYKQNIKYNIDFEHLSKGVICENIPTDIAVPDFIMLLLYCGIGIYLPDILPKNYINTIITLADTNQLSFIISNDNICYGMNYSFNNIIIDDDAVNDHSIDTIFQLCSRVGRIDTSLKSSAYIDSNTITRIIKYILTDSTNIESIESINMNKALYKIIHNDKLSDTDSNDSYSSTDSIDSDAKIIKLSDIYKKK